MAVPAAHQDAAHHRRSADAGAEHDERHVVLSGGDPARVLAEQGSAGVVLDARREPEPVARPHPQVEVAEVLVLVVRHDQAAVRDDAGQGDADAGQRRVPLGDEAADELLRRVQVGGATRHGDLVGQDHASPPGPTAARAYPGRIGAGQDDAGLDRRTAEVDRRYRHGW